MQLDHLKLAMAATPKGANIVLEWIRPAHVRKGISESILKSVRAVGRIGIEYDNVGAVQDKRDNGQLPSVNGGLPKGQEWELYPYLILCPKSGKHLLRLYHGTSASVKPSVQWLRYGQVVEFASIEASLLASEKQAKTGDCFTVNVEDITRLHRDGDSPAPAPAPAPVEVEQEKVSVETEVVEPVTM